MFSAFDVTEDLQLKEVTTTHRDITLRWKRAPSHSNPIGKFSMTGRLRLNGYFLTGMSKRQIVKETVDFALSNYTVADLTPGTKYSIMLRPVYVSERSENPYYRIGRASATDFQTLASAPEAPQSVTLVSSSHRSIDLNIVNPFTWNGDPVGYRVRWVCTGGSGASGENFINIAPSQGQDPINITLALEPGESYTIFISARSTDRTKVTYDGLEAVISAGTLPLGKLPAGLDI